MAREYDPEYVQARRVLLDALVALGSHRKAVVLVGAQAIYHHIGAGHLQVAAFTSDGDLALNPNVLDDEPLLAEGLIAAGFNLAVNPGTWALDDVQIDLMVPMALGGPGRRSARLGPHGTEVARKTRGLEAAIVDNSVVTLTALDPSDTRAVKVAVAGLGALLVAKLHKLSEREGTPTRWVPKDGLDVLRILQAADLDHLGTTLSRLERHEIAGSITGEAHSLLRNLFGSQEARGAAVAVRASREVAAAAAITLSCETLASRLLAVWNGALAERTGQF